MSTTLHDPFTSRLEASPGVVTKLDITPEEIKEVVESTKKRLKYSAYSQFLTGKTAIIVGPAQTVVGKKEGRFIDSFDVIIRFNTTYEHIPFPDDQIVDIGTRTDVLYLAPTCFHDFVQLGVKRCAKCINKGKIKFILYQNRHLGSLYDYNENYLFKKLALDLEERMRKMRVPVTLFYVNESMQVVSNMLAERSGTKVVARTGALSIFDCLVHGAKRIAIRGMTFYHGGGHMFRKIKGELHPLKQHLNHASVHNSILEIDLMKKLLVCYRDRFIIDDTLAHLLDEE